nr:class I SAM-dependent methyltransferase [Pigmentibacter ruber]
MKNYEINNIVSHKIYQGENFEKTKIKIMQRIKEKKLDTTTEQELILLLEKMYSTEMGRFMIEHSGFNGYWTEYVCSYPDLKKQGFKLTENEFEKYLLENLPFYLATQSRFQIFKTEIKKRLRDNISIASLPCGLMTDILLQDFKGINNFQLHGIDLDQSALDQAKAIALSKGLIHHCTFTREDGRKIEHKNQFDLVTSNGFNIYVDDEDKNIAFYKKIYQALTDKGELITSTIVPPPTEDPYSSWELKKINLDALKIQAIVMNYFTEFNKNNFKSAEKLCIILKKAGFNEFQVIPDNLGIFPTIIAKK